MAIKLKGHETFALREGWLNKGLAKVDANPKVFSENYGADALGVGSNMAKAIRYWLKAGKFMEEPPKEGAKLTDIGQIIFKEDKYLEDIFSLWIFHINEFSKEDLMNILLEKLTPLAEEKAIPERSLRDDISVLLNMYVKEKQQNYDPEENKISPFAQLGLLKKDRNNYIKTQPDKDKLCDDAVLYSLIKFFEKKEVDSIGIDELLNSPMSPGRILNLKRMALNEYLDHLEGQGYLTVNRTAGLDMVYLKKKIGLKEVVSNYYKKH